MCRPPVQIGGLTPFAKMLHENVACVHNNYNRCITSIRRPVSENPAVDSRRTVCAEHLV